MYKKFFFLFQGIELTLRMAEKCMRDGDEQTMLSKDPLAWTMIHCPRNNAFMLTATLLMKLHFNDVTCLLLKYMF